MKGKLIVIDGSDGAGKATQTRLLHDKLLSLGHNAQKIDFPRYNDNFFGKLLRRCLDGELGDFIKIDPHIASVIYAADRHESSEEIKRWLDDGHIVISDRYVSANQMHQGQKIEDENKRQEFLTWLDEMEHEVFGIPRPDLIIFLHVPLAVSRTLLIKRLSEKEGQELRGNSVAHSDLAEQNDEYLERSIEHARELVKKRNNWALIECTSDGQMLPPETIHNIVCDKVLSALN